MPSGRQSYDDENLYKKLTVKELNEYTGTERVSYGGRLASKLSVTLFLPVPSSKKKKKKTCPILHLPRELARRVL